MKGEREGEGERGGDEGRGREGGREREREGERERRIKSHFRKSRCTVMPIHLPLHSEILTKTIQFSAETEDSRVKQSGFTRKNSTHRYQDIKKDKMGGKGSTCVREFFLEPTLWVGIELTGDINVV